MPKYFCQQVLSFLSHCTVKINEQLILFFEGPEHDSGGGPVVHYDTNDPNGRNDHGPDHVVVSNQNIQ